MDFKALFSTTSGRISRKTWWIGVILLLIVGAVLSAILGAIGLGATATSAGWGSLIVALLLLYPGYCIGIKRRQDRGNNGLDLKILYGLTLLSALIQALGIGITATDVGNGVLIPTPAGWLMAFMVVLGIFGIYMLVQLGFLKGTPGANAYGADPVDSPALA